MATQGKVLHARKRFECRRGDHVEIGEPYAWFKPRRFGQRRVACTRHPFAPQELRTYGTGKTEQLRMSVDSFGDTEWESPEELQEALDDLISEAREYAEEYRSGADNMESAGMQTEQVYTMQETAEALDAWADELEGIDTDPGVEPDEDDAMPEGWIDEVDLSVLDDLPGYGG